jgi:glycosyltransferase involved in cell wall biosynthesis
MKLGPIFNPFTILRIVRIIKKRKIDAVLTNIDKEIGIGGIAAKICGIPNVRRVGREDDFNDRLRTKLTHRLLVSGCIVPCDYLIEASKKRAPWLNRDEFTTIHNGRNPARKDARKIAARREEWGIRPGEKVIGMTCQLAGVKRVGDLIEVYDGLRPAHPGWKLVIAGEGPEMENLVRLRDFRSLGDKVVFAGFVEDPVFTASCYDICASVSSREGFPNTIVEYFACGKPVVSTRVGGVDEIISDGFNGFTAEFGDLPSFSKKLHLLMEDEGLRDSMGANAVRTLEERFTEDMMIDKLEGYFSNLAKG